MPIKLDQINDPNLRQRIMKALDDAEKLRRELSGSVIIDPPSCSKPKKKRIRQDSKPLMNKLEEEYFDRFGHLGTWTIQSMRFKLANGLWYKPDFLVLDDLSFKIITGIEVKGPHSFRGGFENLKMAAHKYPWINWVLVWKENGEWQEQTVLP
jgi:hypothetical protein